MRISDWSSDVCSSDLQPRQDGHFAAMPYDRVAAFIVTLRAKESFSRLALEFAILTASRSGEVRGATWDEFDLGLRLWTIPKHRMKANREHVVPLCNRAVAIVRRCAELRKIGRASCWERVDQYV